MVKKTKDLLYRFYSVLILSAVAVSCSHIDLDFRYFPEEGRTDSGLIRTPNERFRNVFIVYSMGYNNISRFLQEDIVELQEYSSFSNIRDRILILSHQCKSGNYTTPTSPVLMELYGDSFGNTICDTLKVYPDNVIAADASTVQEVLTHIHKYFPAERYGILFSSHGTGWAPENYCISPSDFDKNKDKDSDIWLSMRRAQSLPKPAWVYPETDDIPMVKGIGVHESPAKHYSEMEITDLAKAIPMKMEYIIFDACFMGGVEVAYELKDVCRMMIGSQTEIIADGMDYQTMASYLLDKETPDLKGFCDNFYRYYNEHSNSTYRSATISLTDCSKLEHLAGVCKEIFGTQRAEIAALEGKGIAQPYYQKSYADRYKWFHDLESIVINSGASEDQIARFQKALNDCILYKAATEKFFNTEITISHHSGLSMYLPFENRTYLNTFYKTLEWNKATGLVQ